MHNVGVLLGLVVAVPGLVAAVVLLLVLRAGFDLRFRQLRPVGT